MGQGNYASILEISESGQVLFTHSTHDAAISSCAIVLSDQCLRLSLASKVITDITIGQVIRVRVVSS